MVFFVMNTKRMGKSCFGTRGTSLDSSLWHNKPIILNQEEIISWNLSGRTATTYWNYVCQGEWLLQHRSIWRGLMVCLRGMDAQLAGTRGSMKYNDKGRDQAPHDGARAKSRAVVTHFWATGGRCSTENLYYLNPFRTRSIFLHWIQYKTWKRFQNGYFSIEIQYFLELDTEFLYWINLFGTEYWISVLTSI